MRNVKALLLIFLLAALFVTLSESVSMSQVSPVKPAGLENCPSACIENYADIGYPTCASSCIADDVYIEPRYITWYAQAMLPTFASPLLPDMASLYEAGHENELDTRLASQGEEWILGDVWYKNETETCLMWTDGERITRLECP